MRRLSDASYFEKFKDINWFIVSVTVFLAGIGVAMMLSAGGGVFSAYAAPQTLRFTAAFAMMLALAVIPMRMLLDYAYLVYAGCLLILVAVEAAGFIGMGAQRWLRFGGFNLQPSEFMKLALVLALARYFHRLHSDDIRRFQMLIPPVLIILVPAIFILRQPNLGTTSILVAVGMAMCFLAGVQWRYFISIGAAGISALPVAWHFLHDYQKRRVLTFLDPQQDPLGAGYNILQSMIAIGSGGLFGKGYLQGSQSQLNFLPEKHTDFIFTMLAEEFGFAGSMVTLGLYMVLLGSGMAVAMLSRSIFGAMIAAGVTAMIFFHLLINCAMVMGLIPVVGVPLPLMSYGGSIMFSTLLGVGLLLNAWVHRDRQPVRMAPRF